MSEDPESRAHHQMLATGGWLIAILLGLLVLLGLFFYAMTAR